MMDASKPARNSRDFVLVHGRSHGGWCWSRVADLLRAQGHRAFTPTFTGLGERSHLLSPDITFNTHVLDIVNVIRWERLNNFILCGHSYGGSVVTAVADIMPERIASLVYLDAPIARSGESIMDILSPVERSRIPSIVTTVNGVEVVPAAPAAYYNLNEADRAMFEELSTPHPLRTMDEPILYTGAHENVRKRTYIRAPVWDADHPQATYERVKNDPRWTTMEIPYGHDVMLDAPELVAKLLVEAM